MAEGKKEPLPETQPEEGLSEKLNSILEGDVTVRAGEEPTSKKDEDYIYIYRGKALNQEELFRFSARRDVKQILVAGPYSSGKTTLIVMLYYLFLEGYNHTLRFAGSMTLEGFKSRSKKLHLSSGEAKPLVDRTSRSEQDRYLHLALMDESGRKGNLILTDISGELFSSEYMDELSELYGDSENIILTVDGQKLQNPKERQNEVFQSIHLLKQLLNSGIITKRSKLQIVCTKRDLIEAGSCPEKTIDYLKIQRDRIKEQYTTEVSSLEFHLISALKLDHGAASESLEKIMLNCMEGKERKIVTFIKEPKLQRYFDKFKMRG